MTYATFTEPVITPTSRGPSWRAAFLSAAAISAGMALLLYFPDQDDGSGVVLAGLLALLPLALALRVVSRFRPLPPRSMMTGTRLAALALAAGLLLGLANLGVNYAMATLDPKVHQQMVTRWAEFSSWSVVIAEPIVEEIVFRLILLTALAWIAARFTSNPRLILLVAIGISATLFGVAHIFYGGVHTPLYAAGMAVKSAGAGVLLGWVFWRWGTPYSALAHCAANAIHLLLMPAIF